MEGIGLGKIGHASLRWSHTVTPDQWTRSSLRPHLSDKARSGHATQLQRFDGAIRHLAGRVPAEIARTPGPRSWLTSTSAIWLRQELPVHRINTVFCHFIFSFINS